MSNSQPIVEKFSAASENVSKDMQSALRICNLGDSYLKSSDYENALDSYQVALQMMQKEAGKSHICNSHPLKGMGVVYFHMGGNDDKSYSCLVSAKNILQKRGEKYSLTSGEIYDLMGDIHRRKGQLRKAQRCYRDAIRILKKVSAGASSSSAYELAQIMSRITHKRGLVYQEQGHSKKAMKLFEESQDVLPKETSESSRREFMLNHLPKIKHVTSSQSSVQQCMSQLSFFSQIPSICERLRKEMHDTQKTSQKWKAMQSICTEHLGLEILLIETVSGFKNKIEKDNTRQATRNPRKSVMPRRGNRFSMVNLQSRRKLNASSGYDQVKRFVNPYVKDVWDLGDQIVKQILVGTDSSFADLIFNDPDSMKAITEAVDVYDIAANQYEDFYGESEFEAFGMKRLRFTDIRTELVAQIYKDCEQRCLNTFTSLDIDEIELESDAVAVQRRIFESVLVACTKLTEEIEPIKECFPLRWVVDIHWGCCVAYQCSKQIQEQIGGANGNNLPKFSITQLLQLISWAERYNEVMKESFPNITSKMYKDMHLGKHHPKYTSQDETTNATTIDKEHIIDSFIWSNNVLWEVQRLAQEEFLVRTQDTTDEFLTNVYSTEPVKIRTNDGRIMTTLCEDVFALAKLEIQTLQENLSPKSDLFMMAINVVFSRMHLKQIKYRDTFLEDFDCCCAAANDFINMSEQMEEMTSRILNQCQLSEQSATSLREITSELIVLYGNDAIYAAQSVHVHIFEPIRYAIGDDLFGWDWEDKLTRNELALTLVRTVDDFMVDLGKCMDDFLLKKTLDALVPASTMFYLRCLLRKAVMQRGVGVSLFQDNEKALRRFTGDIEAMREYFDSFVHALPALKGVIQTQFGILISVHDVMIAAKDGSCGDAFDPILLLHKEILDVRKTKQFIIDLWCIVNPLKEEKVKKFLKLVEPKLRKISSKHSANVTKSLGDRPKILGLKLDELLTKVANDEEGLGWGKRVRHEVQKACGCDRHGSSSGRNCDCTAMCLNPKEIVDIMYSIPAK